MRHLTNTLCSCAQGQQAAGHFGYLACVLSCAGPALSSEVSATDETQYATLGEAHQLCHLQPRGDGNFCRNPWEGSHGRWLGSALISGRSSRAVLSLGRVSGALLYSLSSLQLKAPHFCSSSAQGLWGRIPRCASPACTQGMPLTERTTSGHRETSVPRCQHPRAPCASRGCGAAQPAAGSGDGGHCVTHQSSWWHWICFKGLSLHQYSQILLLCTQPKLLLQAGGALCTLSGLVVCSQLGSDWHCEDLLSKMPAWVEV